MDKFFIFDDEAHEEKKMSDTHYGYEEEDEENEEKYNETYLCEDCDYRWEHSGNLEEEDMNSKNYYCPMCGSNSILQIQ